MAFPGHRHRFLPCSVLFDNISSLPLRAFRIGCSRWRSSQHFKGLSVLRTTAMMGVLLGSNSKTPIELSPESTLGRCLGRWGPPFSSAFLGMKVTLLRRFLFNVPECRGGSKGVLVMLTQSSAHCFYSECILPPRRCPGARLCLAKGSLNPRENRMGRTRVV